MAARPMAFVVHGLAGFLPVRPEHLQALGPQTLFHPFVLPGLFEPGQTRHRVADLASDYCAILRRKLPRGPVHLAGFCVGSLVAVEMARQLLAEGRAVRRLVLLDPNVSMALERLLRAGRWNDPAQVARYESEARRQGLEKAIRRRLEVELADRRTGPFAGRPAPSIEVLAKFESAVQTYRPPVLPIRTHVVASHERLASWNGPSVWTHCLPRRAVLVAAARHQDLVSRVSTATLLERLMH